MSPADFQSVAQVIEASHPMRFTISRAGRRSRCRLLSLQRHWPAYTLNMLEALRRLRGRVRFYNAGSSECFGDTGTRAANEQTAFRPKSPYGVAKAAAISLEPVSKSFE
jgi:GDPmannose 4,6-dehydratase